jgi:hypothetical protein
VGRNRRQTVSVNPSLHEDSAIQFGDGEDEDGDTTQSDKDSAPPRDSVGQKLPPDHAATRSCDSGSEEDANSHLGQKHKGKRAFICGC